MNNFQFSDQSHPLRTPYVSKAMAGTRFVYGDGWEDIKDCFSGTLGLNRGHPDNTGGSSSRSSRQRVYGGDHYVHPHHLGSSSRRSEGCCGLDLGECMGDLAGTQQSCNKTRLGLSVLFLWVILLTIVCIVLGSNIGKKHFFIFRTI